MRKGLLIINTGPGKGKTTAAMGTALRAVGNGMRVLMLQFLKGSWHYGELDAVQSFGQNFVLRQMGRGFVKVGGAETDPEDIRLVEAAWAEAGAAQPPSHATSRVTSPINFPRMISLAMFFDYLPGGVPAATPSPPGLDAAVFALEIIGASSG